MRRRLLWWITIPLIALGGCTLTSGPRETATPQIITATLSDDVVQALNATQTPTPSRTPSHTPTPAATGTPANTNTPVVTATATPSPTPPPTFTPVPTLAPTRTAQATVPLPLDDGSGRLIPGTGGNPAAVGQATGAWELTESLYFLADHGGVDQVFRLRVGLTAPDQLTLNPTGVQAYDVAPNGALAYITPEQLLIVQGVPVVPPNEGAGSEIPQVTAVAWSARGDWLAFCVQTPGADQTTSGEHPTDGLWVRSTNGQLIRLIATTYGSGSARQIFSGPLNWRADSSEILATAAMGTDAAPRYTRVSLTNSRATPLEAGPTLPPDQIESARWSQDGSAILVAGAGRILRLIPNVDAPQIVLDGRAGYFPTAARDTAGGTVVFLNRPQNDQGESGPAQLYAIRPGEALPVPVSDTLTPANSTDRLDFAWDSRGAQTVIVIYAAGNPVGTPYLRDTGSIRHDLSGLLGLIAAPQWAPIFKPGDPARIQGESINLRALPGGDVITSVVNGSPVRVLAGPQTFDGVRWWQVQTPGGVSGWVVEAVRDAQGQTRRTLIPTP